MKYFGQHRAIRQEVSDRIFAPIQSLGNEGMLYVFLVFQTEEVGQKDGRDSQTQLCGVALRKKRRNPLKISAFFLIWSECRDSNPRPLGPEPSAIPSFATPR